MHNWCVERPLRVDGSDAYRPETDLHLPKEFLRAETLAKFKPDGDSLRVNSTPYIDTAADTTLRVKRESAEGNSRTIPLLAAGEKLQFLPRFLKQSEAP